MQADVLTCFVLYTSNDSPLESTLKTLLEAKGKEITSTTGTDSSPLGIYLGEGTTIEWQHTDGNENKDDGS